MKFSKDGKICAIDDHIPTDEEIDESLKNVPPEVLAQWNREFEEWNAKRKKENNNK